MLTTIEMKRIMWMMGCLGLCLSLHGQQIDTTTYQGKYEYEYQRRIRMTHINGTYIPRDLSDAMAHLDRVVEDAGKRRFAAQPEDVAVRKMHFSFGRWMVVNWGFYEGSRLSHFLKKKGISYPDDMAAVLMRCYHRKLNQKPLGFDELATEIEEMRRKEVEQRLQQGDIIERQPGKVEKQ